MANRFVQIFVDGVWATFPFRNVKKGDLIRLFEPPDKVVTFEKRSEFRVLSDPKPRKVDGILTASVE